MDNNIVRIDPNIDPAVKAYLGNKKEGDTVDLRLRGTVVSIEDDAVTINIDDIVKLPEWGDGKDDESDSSDASESRSEGDTGDDASVSSAERSDEDRTTPIMIVFGQASKKKSKRD